MSSKWSTSSLDTYLKNKKDHKESINFSSQLVDTIIKLVLDKSQDNRIVYLKDQDIFCLKGEVDEFAEKIKNSIRYTGHPCELPVKNLQDLCDEGYIYIQTNTLSSYDQRQALNDYEKYQKEQAEIKNKKSNY